MIDNNVSKRTQELAFPGKRSSRSASGCIVHNPRWCEASSDRAVVLRPRPSTPLTCRRPASGEDVARPLGRNASRSNPQPPAGRKPIAPELATLIAAPAATNSRYSRTTTMAWMRQTLTAAKTKIRNTHSTARREPRPPTTKPCMLKFLGFPEILATLNRLPEMTAPLTSLRVHLE